ncbi:DUF1080 domain-containing protein [Rhodocytophaga rosea]|uniref:DUF1080 domain-containing protein n=1 Tax=Rhodocytophaga rosea TaxID=2704465 RepID=A0A6C0GQL3_9BACT|nr:family 16 glycoside hydrolase [Rhodocytophaga rosea]QHT70351.1 DUF1080 domain-containing protein [Rhodocytophaga rosea]
MFSRCLLISLALLISHIAAAQQAKKNSIDLGKVLDGKAFKVVNRSASKVSEGKYQAIHLDARASDGVLWLDNISFSGGTIECDIKGKDEFQKSFVGIAFFGQNDATYEGIYFRPFNFQAQDSLRKMHAVQYIFHPEFTWDKLRKEYPEVYENPVQPVPDPNGWFHVRIEVNSPDVRVFVNDAKEPSLGVKQLSKNTSGKIGLWVGNQSEGDFANLVISPAKESKRN